MILILILILSLKSTDTYPNNYELYNSLLVAKTRIERLRKQKAALVKERDELLNSYEASLERCIYLEEKIEQLADQLAKWIDKYEKLLKRCEDKGIQIIPYIKVGGSHKHIRAGLGLNLRINRSLSIYGEAFGKHDRWNDKRENGFYYEAGMMYEFK